MPRRERLARPEYSGKCRRRRIGCEGEDSGRGEIEGEEDNRRRRGRIDRKAID